MRRKTLLKLSGLTLRMAAARILTVRFGSDTSHWIMVYEPLVKISANCSLLFTYRMDVAESNFITTKNNPNQERRSFWAVITPSRECLARLGKSGTRHEIQSTGQTSHCVNNTSGTDSDIYEHLCLSRARTNYTMSS